MLARWRVAAVALALLCAGCWKEPPAPVPQGGDPRDFVGAWVLRPSLGANDTTEVNVTLARSSAGVPSVAGGLYLEGRFGPNELISGTATATGFNGELFAARGTLVGNDTRVITMQLLGNTRREGLAVIDKVIYYDMRRRE